PPRFQIPLFDISNQPDKDAEAHRITLAEYERAFNLESDLMIRAILVRLEPDRHQLLFTIITSQPTDGRTEFFSRKSASPTEPSRRAESQSWSRFRCNIR